MRSLSLIGVTGDAYRAAVQASVLGVGVNDALTYIAMAEKGINEAYSFDRRFDQLSETTRITS
jgi:predicted nucleic acid-binding protein